MSKETEPTKEAELDRYDAGLLNDFGGGNVQWWQDYIRAELERAHDHYQDQLARRDEARDAALLKPWREAAKFLKTRHSAYCSTVECNCSPDESAINSLIALLSQPAAEEPCEGIKKGLRCSPCVKAKRTCQPEGLP